MHEPPAAIPCPPLIHPERMQRDDSILLIVDAQQKLLPVVRDHKRVTWNLGRLAQGAQLLGVPVIASEQYPQGLGATAAELQSVVDQVFPKMAFSCGAESSFRDKLRSLRRAKILLAGIETHVCVMQTAMDLVTEGYLVQVAVDATSTRYSLDHEIALRRMESQGITLSTVETALFEWCAVSGTPEFKQISALVRQSAPK